MAARLGKGRLAGNGAGFKRAEGGRAATSCVASAGEKETRNSSTSLKKTHPVSETVVLKGNKRFLSEMVLSLNFFMLCTQFVVSIVPLRYNSA